MLVHNPTSEPLERRCLGAYQLKKPELPKFEPRKIVNFTKALNLDEVFLVRSFFSTAFYEFWVDESDS